MAAFATFTEESLKRYLVMFGKGGLKKFTSFDSGIEHSNFFVTLDGASGDLEYVPAISEQFGFDDVSFFNKVVSHLFHQGLPAAAPLPTLDGISSTMFCGKPTFLQPGLEGSHLATVNDNYCFQIGKFLEDAHRALRKLKATRMNLYHLGWVQSTLSSISDRLSEFEKT